MDSKISEDSVVEWYITDCDSLKANGVEYIGYLGDALVGFNEIVIGDLVSIRDPDWGGNLVLERKYESLRVTRRSDETDTQRRRRGMLQPAWSKVGPWRIIEVTQDGSFGINQRIDDGHSDLLVRPDQVTKYRRRGDDHSR